MRRSAGAILLLIAASALAACTGPNPWWQDSPWWDSQYYSRGASPAGQREANGPYVVVVRPGDTVYSLSRRHEVPVRSLIETNRLSAPFRIYPNQKLKIPAKRYHVVARGETVYGISRQYGVDTASLAQTNGIRSPYTISVGQKLQIPGGGSVRPASGGAQKTVARTTTRTTQKVARTSQPNLPPSPKREGAFSWPVEGRVVSRFGPKENGLHNDGINIAVPAGTKVKAAQSGVVAYSGNELKGYGNLLLIRHSDGWMTAYAHNDRLLVRRGDTIKKGQIIAVAGSTGTVTSPQVHFEIRKGSKALDPEKVING